MLGGFAAAYMLNGSAKRSLARTEGMICFLRYVKNQVDCYAKPIEKILSECTSEIYINCGYFKDSTPSSLAEFMSEISPADPRTHKIMTEFSEEFGKSYRSEQVKLCERYIEELSAARAEMSEKLPQRKKLNSTLCISGAMAIVILLI